MMARLRATSEIEQLKCNTSRLKLIRVLRWVAGLVEDRRSALMATRVS